HGRGVDLPAAHARPERGDQARLVVGRLKEIGRVVVGRADQDDAIFEQVVGDRRRVFEEDVAGGEIFEGGRATAKVNLHRRVVAQRDTAVAELDRLVGLRI